jgi:hypothetical protein
MVASSQATKESRWTTHTSSFARVVEVELELVGGGGHGLTARELELTSIRYSWETWAKLAALIGVEVDVVDVERR